MANILAIPAEFDKILVGYVQPGTSQAYGKKRLMPRPPLGPFTHHAVGTFAKTCSEGQVGHNWRQHLLCAQQTWKDLDEEAHSSLNQAAERDKKRYDEQVKEQPAGVPQEPKLDEKLADTGITPKKRAGGGAKELLEEKIAGTGIAPSAFDLFKDSPTVRSRLYEAKEGPIGYHELYGDKVFRWLWGRIEEEEKAQWRDDAKRRLDITNEARRLKGEKELVLDTEPGAPENPAQKRTNRHPSTLRQIWQGRGNLDRISQGKNCLVPGSQNPSEGVAEEKLKEREEDAVNEQKEPEEDAEDEHMESEEDAKDAEEGPEDDEEEQIESQQVAEVKENESQEVAEDDDEDEAGRTEGQPLDLLPWIPTEDHNLSKKEKKLLESIRPNLRRWDRPPRTGRSAYSLYYANRCTEAHSGENPHSSATRVKIHAEWEAADYETKHHFEALAKTDEEVFQRQSEEYKKWQKDWYYVKSRMLLRKVIDRWQPQTSFDEGQNQNRVRSEIPRLGPEPLHPDYGLHPLYYPVIRTDYSNDAVYKHIKHVLHHSGFEGDPTSIEMTFYDGMEPVSLKTEDNDDPWPAFAKEDPRASDPDWCKTHLANKSIDDLKTSFGELEFHRRQHIPVYSLGGRSYAIVIDSQSMNDGTVVFVSLSQHDIVDTRPDDRRGPDGAWEEDKNKQWYLAPRVQAADVVIQLVNLDIANVSWDEYLQYRKEDGLSLISDPKSQQWRGWQWAIEYIFGEQALEKVVGPIQSIPSDACLPEEDEEEDE